ncbi:MAG: TetR/AcrR family transcriptional regulator [Polyangiaceae bacterium]
MARKPTSHADPVRKRRSADEAREAILDVAERALVAAGPAGIRLQEVAADVGVSHPTVLHHFGSREGLIEAVVARALESLHAGLLEAVQTAPKGPDKVESLLERVAETMVSGGHARAFLWLALSGYEPSMEQLHVRSLAEAVHEVRRGVWAQRGEKGKRVPPFEDTYFTVLLPALALLSMSVMGGRAIAEEGPCGPKRFRAWLARLIHDHLQRGG